MILMVQRSARLVFLVNYDEAFRDIVRGVLRVASGHGAPE